MVNYYIYAKDFSGSTNGVEHYHSNGLKSLNQFRDDVKRIKKELIDAGDTSESKVIFLHWGDKCFEVDELATELAYKELACGYMGTEPETIIQWIQQTCDINDVNDKIKLLYIITDGLIDGRSRQKCFKLNENMHYEKVVFHAFHTDLEQIDISVAVSFLKSHCMIYRNYELFDNVNISEEFDYDHINIDNFITERENLKSYIRLKYINKDKHDALSLKAIQKLKNLRDRLFVEMSSKSQKSEVDLDTKDKNVFLSEFKNTDWYRNLNAPSHSMKIEIEKSISTLINYIVSDSKSYSFDALKFDMKFDNPVEDEPIVDVNFSPEQEIEFPDIIMYDDKGIPVIILTEFNLLDKIIFHKTKATDEVSPASFNKFKTAMECPLFLLNDKDISESIGYFYTLNVYKMLIGNAPRVEPRSRKPFHGGLVLTDTDEFDSYNDYILAATYFDFKKIHYNIPLFYYVLWKNAENKEWMDKAVLGEFKKYVMRRIGEAKCKVGLSSLPLDPPNNTSLLTALWYCVELSSCIFKVDPLNFMHERLRMFCGVANNMIEILKHFNYDLDINSIENRADLIRHVVILKRIPTRNEKAYFLLEKIFKKVNGFLVSEIENPLNLNKLNYLKVNHKGMFSDHVLEEKVNLNDYVHLMHCNLGVSTNGEVIVICEKTYRPFFVVNQCESFYSELKKNLKKVVINDDDDKDKIKITYDVVDSIEFDRILSLYNLFIKCVHESEKYPTLSEYTEYISKKKKYQGDLVTIFPPKVYCDIEEVYSLYQNIVTKVDVKTFITISKNNVKRTRRIENEGVLKFTNEKQIEEFILNEELKVNLIKKVQ